MYVLSPILPKFAEAKAVVRFLNGNSVSDIADLIGKIKEQTGNPRNPVNFSEPDVWIKKLLDGNEQKLAIKLWKDSDKQANPRYLQRSEKFSVWSDFLKADEDYIITDKGKKFINNDEEVIGSVDSQEGIYFVLKIIKEQGSCKKSNLLIPWANFLNERGSRISTDSVIRLSLWYRLSNLLHRGLVKRKGFRYSLTAEGKNCLKNLSLFDAALKKKDSEQKEKNRAEEKIDEKAEEALEEVLEEELNEQQSIIDTIEIYNKSVLEDFQNKLLNMHFVQFENFVGKLLTAMGYSVKVTKPIGDDGIDVVAKSRSGLMENVEVFQVKRTKSLIGNSLITNLRGAMNNYRTSLGGFVTLGKYANRTRERVAEDNKTQIQRIKLIDGEELLELTVQYEIGITKAKVEYEIYEIDSEVFE